MVAISHSRFAEKVSTRALVEVPGLIYELVSTSAVRKGNLRFY